NEAQAKEILARTSMKTVSPDWSPLMPVCANCGRIATTMITTHDKDSYEYNCIKDVKYTKGCGHKGKNKISDHKHKLVWRLHWPAWQDYFNSSSEGAGVDHFTKGGSWDTAKAVHNELFKKKEPIGFKFGFVLFRGKKYSKSSGIGMGVKDLIKLMPPELIKYALLRPDLQENKDIDPTGLKLISLYDEVQSIYKLSGDSTTRAERKKIIALRLSADMIRWNSSFTDILIYYQIYNDWNKVISILNDKGGISYIAPYVEAWVSKGLQPEEYKFSFKPQRIEENANTLLKFADTLDVNMSSLDVHNLVFNIAKENNLKPDELFKTIYKALLSKDNGPRVGKLITALGVEKVKLTLKNLYTN
ncbi:lysine--tRNA ligase, partial [Candidatus Micrarchaeota archaeon]|nr:lysine--tRNA ligase [Candidatus Micrarchaeota archaeon]